MVCKALDRVKGVPPGTPILSRVPGKSVKHAAHSPEILSVNAGVLRNTLIEVYPWIMESDAVAIEQYCRAEARARLLGDYLVEICATQGPSAVPGYLWKSASDADSVAMRAATSLGLTPEGRLKIAKDAGFASHFQGEKLRGLVEQGAEMRRRR